MKRTVILLISFTLSTQKMTSYHFFISKWLTLIVGVCLAFSLNAQELSYRTYTLQDGLAQMQVNAIYRDSRGLLWIGTRGGISKFDGEKFVSYYTSDGLPGRSITAIHEDKKGIMWFATRNGICSFDGNSFKAFPFGEIPIGSVLRIEQDDEDNIWLAREAPPYFLYFKGNEYHVLPDNLNHIPNQKARLCYDINEKKIFGALSRKGIFRLNTDGLEKVVLQDKVYSSVRFDKQLKKTIRYEGFGKNKVDYFIFENNESKLFVECQGKKIKVNFDLLDKSIYFHFLSSLYFFDLEKKEVILLHSFNKERTKFEYLDQSGQIWLGSENGLIQFFGNAFKTFEDSRLDKAWSFLEDDQQNIYLSSYHNGLFKLDKSGNIQSLDNSVTLNTMYYFGSFKDKNNNLLFPHGNGILKYNSNEFSLIDGVQKNKPVLYLMEDTERDQLISGVAGGINIYKDYKFSEHIGQKDGVHKCTYIVGLCIDKNNHYWLGSFTGLTKYDPETKEIANFVNQDGSLPSQGGISACYKDDEDRIWFGGGEGLLTFDYRNNKLIKIGHDFLNKPISFITKFNESNLLIGALDGLYIFNQKKYIIEGIIEMKFFNHQNGYEGIEPNQNTVFTDSDGIIWIGSATKTVCLDPSKLDLKSESINAIISSVNNKKLSFDQDSVFIEEGNNKIEFGFGAIGFNRPSITQYAHQLEGYEKDWSSWVENSYVNYSNLGSGTYQFKVKSRNAGSQDLESKVASIFVIVDIPFYSEPNFYLYAFLILTLMFLGLIFLFNRYRHNKRAAYENELRATHLEVQSLQSQMNPHFIFNVIGTIQNQILNNDAEEANELLVKFSAMIRRFLDSGIKSEIDLTNKISQEITLQEELELLRIYVEFEHLSAPDAFDYEFIIDQNIDLNMTTIPPMLIQPYIENAIQHGLIKCPTKEMLYVKVMEKGETLIVVIEDHGIGIDFAKKLKENSIAKYKSHGRELVRRKINLLNELDYDITTNTEVIETGGTRVTLKILKN